MKNSIKTFFLCPVPEDQKPINEYIGLKENSFTNWTTLDERKYSKKIQSFFFQIFLSVFLFKLSLSLSSLSSLSFSLSFFFPFSLWKIEKNFEMSTRFQQLPILSSKIVEIVLESSFISSIVFSFIFLILFFRWKQLNKKLNSSRFVYEEASWYDGQIWEKPFSLIKNEKLMSTQKIQPILDRLLETLLSSISFSIFNFFLISF